MRRIRQPVVGPGPLDNPAKEEGEEEEYIESSSSDLIYRLDNEKGPLALNFQQRRWESWASLGRPESHLWNLYWTSAHNVRMLFDIGSGIRLNENQIVNHFPNFYELTRKDAMFKNVRRYCRARSAGDPRWDFVPPTLTLPSDVGLFEEEHRRHPQGTRWIAKPAAGSQGKNIYLFTKRKAVRTWLQERETEGERDTYVISRYIGNPFLIGRRKFDLRLYVLVLSFSPLRALLHRDGFARFCSVPYTEEEENIDAHLTNVAIQKANSDYNNLTGGKWSYGNVLLHLEGTCGRETAKDVEESIEFVLKTTLRSVQGPINNDGHCFELYGFDILLDAELKPWLIEVNASPSLSATTEWDEKRKVELIGDVLNVVVPPGFPTSNPHPYSAHRRQVTGPLGGFRFLIDELNGQL